MTLSKLEHDLRQELYEDGLTDKQVAIVLSITPREDLHDGVAGFGKSPELAYQDFDREWNKKLARKKIKGAI